MRIDGDLHAGLGQDHIAQEVFVREFRVDPCGTVGGAEGRLNDGVGVPGQDGHGEREQRRSGIAQGFDFAAEHIGHRLEGSLDGPAQAVGLGDQLRADLGGEVCQDVDFVVARFCGRV